MAEQAKDSNHLEALKQQAEAQMRRRIHPCEDRPLKRQNTSRQGSEPGCDGDGEFARYKYAALDVRGSCDHQGFLVTCGFQREKSATKEAIALLTRYTQQPMPQAGTANADTSSYRPEDNTFRLSLVKLACSGVVLLIVSSQGSSVDPVEAVQRAMQGVQRKEVSSPQFVQRILPVQAMAPLRPARLKSSAEALVDRYYEAHLSAASMEGPLRFAVAYKSRGAQAPQVQAEPSAETSPSKQPQAAISLRGAEEECCHRQAGQSTSPSPVHPPGLHEKSVPEGDGPASAQVTGAHRSQVIASLASGIESRLSAKGVQVQVDLKRPQVVLLAEIIPTTSHDVCALALVDATMVTCKPKLMIRALTSS